MRSPKRTSKKRRVVRRALLVETAEPRILLAGNPVITEFMAENTATLADNDGQFSDWIEIHNPDPAPLNLAGWHLTDNDGDLGKWAFPAVVLDPGAYLVVYASNQNRADPSQPLHTNFRLDNDGEFLALVAPDGATIAQSYTSENGRFPQQYADVSYGLIAGSTDEAYFLAPSPGATNSGVTTTDPTADVAITEIMYHPLGNTPSEEYIEIHNRSATAVNLSGWQFVDGVNFTFPMNTQLGAGNYLVVAANVAAFQASHPGVTNVIGGWTGELSNSGEQIDLVDADGNRIDQVEYADEGDWATRRRGPLDNNHRGWIWDTSADGGGHSVERVSLSLSNNSGQNWAESGVRGGTPGAANSTADANVAPLIRNVAQLPVVPKSSETVTITATISDELTTGVAATLFYRIDGAASFSSKPMFDNGASGDGAPGDGQFGATLNPLAGGDFSRALTNLDIIEYYVRATDAASNVRIWPAPAELGPNIVGRWSFEEGVGTRTVDLTGNGNEGRLTDGASFTPVGRFGAAVNLDGSDDRVVVEPRVVPGPPLGLESFTLATWFRRTGNGVTVSTGTGGITAEPLIAKGRDNGGDGQLSDLNYFLGLSQSGANWVLAADFEEHISTANPGQNHPLVGSTTITNDVWHHAAVSYDGTTLRLYLNGNLEGSVNVGRMPNWESTQRTTLGATLSDVGSAAGGFEGQLDEAYVFDGALAATDLAALIASNTYNGGATAQSANALYQVDNSTDGIGQPYYRVIMTAADAAELDAMGSPATCDDIMDLNSRCDARSDAQFNATFITSSTVETEIRHTSAIRLRGNNTRVTTPTENRYNNFRVNIPSENPLDGRTAITLNARDTESQLAGSVLWTAAGLVASDARAVQLRINGTTDLTPGQAPHYGSYVHVETLDSDFTDEHFPGDGNGNLYRGVRNVRPSPDVEADLAYLGLNPDAYRTVYPKSTNEAEDNWADLIELANVFTNAPAATFAADIAEVIDVDQWLRYLALDALLSNDESGLQTGIGDDYAMYRGVTDTRFKLVPRDLDTLLGRGNTPTDFDDNGIWGITDIAAFDRLLSEPVFASRYLQHMEELATTILAPAEFNPLLDNALGHFVPASEIGEMKTYLAARINWIFTTQLNQGLTVSSTLPLDTAWNRLRRTTTNSTALTGEIDAINTQSVRVNGVAATISASTNGGTWSAQNISLNPGINRVVVEAFDGPAGTGNRIGMTHVDIWYDTSTGATGATVNVPLGAVWKYLDNGVLPPNDAQGDTWREHDFDDTAWASGPAQLGYGENDQATTIDCGPGPASDCAPGNNSTNKYLTSYFRHSFNIAAGDAAKFDSLAFTITYDDGAVVYINGTEVDRFNMPAAPAAIGNATPASAGGENTITTRTLNLNLAQWANLLRDGINTIAVEVHQDAADSSDVSFDFTMTAQEVVAGGGTTVAGGNLTGVTTWTAANGPYNVTGNITVPAGSTLNIEPGTSVFFEAGTRLTVNGILDAQGTPHQRIRFSTRPGTAQVANIRPELGLAPPHWGGVHIAGSNSPLNIISHADFEFAQPTPAQNDGSIGVVGGGRLVLDDITNFGSHLRWIYVNASSITIRNSVLYDMFENCDCPAGHPQSMTPPIDNIAEHIKGEGGIPAGGHFIIENNIIGRNRGHNDNIDVDSEQWPNPILVIRNNVFLGTGDEAQDGGGDFLFEGNIVADFEKDIDNDGTGDSNVISTGDTETTVAMIVRNTFTNIDHVANFKTGSYGYFENNTVVDIAAPRISLPTDPPSRMLDFNVINFLIPHETNPTTGTPRDWPPGLGAYTAGNIFVDIPETVFGHVDFVHQNQAQFPFLPQELELYDSLVPNAAVLANADGQQGRVFEYTIGDPRFLDKAGRDYRLGPGSPAIGTGPNGIDMGALVAEGASISGEPPAITSSTNATLTIGGPGVLSFIYRIDGGPWSSEIEILDPRENLTELKTRVVELPLTGLANGPHTVEVRGRNFAGELQAVPSVSKTWTVDTSLYRVELSEVLASNVEAYDVHGTRPDLIELYNASATAFDLSGMSISDNPTNPFKYVFPLGTTIPAGGYRTFYADNNPSTPTELHLGFSLKSNEGDGVYLFDGLGELVDSVEFGVQIDDYSIARLGHNGEWGLAQPAFGAPNIAQPTGDPRNLNINEWFTAGQYTLAGEVHTNDFIELYNADTLPVALGGLHLTDDIVAGKTKFEIAPLSFVAPLSPTVFTADNDVDRGADHTNFGLAHEQGEIGLFATDGVTRLDYAIYGPQRLNSSQGVVPDGGSAYQFFAQPSPGVALDSSPPSMPQNLAVTPVSPTRNDLSWTASDDPQSGVDHYNVYRNGVLLGTSDDTSFSDTGVVTGASYTYRVSAVNGDGLEGALSAPVSVGADQTPPSIPTNLAVTEAIASGNVNLSLSWSPSQDNESNFKDYRVYRNGTLIATVTGTTYTDLNVSAASVVEYRVSARNEHDLESERSLPIYVAQLQNGVSQGGAYNGTLDVWINENNEGQQNGDTTSISVDGQNPEEEIGLIRWDLSSIPSNAEVQRASLLLNITNNSPQPYEMYQARRDWVENQANFNIASLASPWQTPGARGTTDRGTAVLGNLLHSTAVARATFPLNAAGTALVEQWVQGAAANYGFIMSDPANDNGLQFTATESTNGALRPTMLVVYSTPLPDDTTPPSTPSGLSATDNGASEIALTWNPSQDNESGVDNYRVFRDGAFVGTVTTPSFTDTEAIPGATYSYTVSAVNGDLVESPQSAPLVYSIDVPMAGRSLVLQTRDSYLPGVPVLVRVEIHDASGKPDRSLWDAAVSLSSNNPSVALSESEVILKNGLGSILVTPAGSGMFTLSVTVNGVTTQKTLTDLSSVAQTNVSGTLPGTTTTWSGIVHITDDLIVPAGHTLTVLPGTLILIDGDATPQSQTANRITVQGRINSIGTSTSPITFTATNPNAPWGELFHNNAQPSEYRYTDITRAGHSTDQGHTSTGPALRTTNSSVTFDHSNITDVAGKIGWATGGAQSNWIFRDSLFARAVMGPEIEDTALLMEDHWTMDMLARYREDGLVDDDDGIYIREQMAGQDITLRRTVFVHGEDDAIDTLASTVLLEDSIIRDWASPLDDSKGISISGGSVTIRRSLIVDNTLGVAAKALGQPSSTNFIEHSTIVNNGIGIERTEAAAVTFTITNSIIRAPVPANTIYEEGRPDSITINYSNLSEAWPGTGNQTADPQLANPAAHDYRLRSTSPAIDAGNPASPLDPDGTRADMGAFPFSSGSGPYVVGVSVRGSTWSQGFLNRLQADGLGTGGFALAHANSNSTAQTLPWNNVNQISITFSEPVIVAADDLWLYGLLSTDYGAGHGGFDYNAATNTATWTTAIELPVDRFIGRLSDVTDLSGIALDGEADGAFPSGDGSAGGDFHVRFNVLPGDNNGDATVSLNDVYDSMKASFRDTTRVGYATDIDIDGNGLINVVDAVLTRNHIGNVLPNGEPPAFSPVAGQSPQAIVVELADDLRTARVLSGADDRSIRRRTDLSNATARTTVRAAIAVDQVLAQDNVDSASGVARLRATRRLRTLDASLTEIDFVARR
jgi:fibronectin type 3 domain-containing protein